MRTLPTRTLFPVAIALGAFALPAAGAPVTPDSVASSAAAAGGSPAVTSPTTRVGEPWAVSAFAGSYHPHGRTPVLSRALTPFSFGLEASNRIRPSLRIVLRSFCDFASYDSQAPSLGVDVRQAWMSGSFGYLSGGRLDLSGASVTVFVQNRRTSKRR